MKTRLGKVISLIPGKSEEWLMLEFSDRCDLYFRGDRSQPSAFIEIKVFGGVPEACLDRLTKAVCEVYETELQIAGDRIYVKYEDVEKWGWNGSNF